MNNNILILPILIPLLSGIVLIFFRQQVRVQRALSIVALLGLLVVSAYLVQRVYDDGIQTLEIGNWQPPFGIVLVADMFASLLVMTTSIVAVACLWFGV